MHIKVKRFSLTLLQTQNAATNFQSLSPCHLDISQVKMLVTTLTQLENYYLFGHY